MRIFDELLNRTIGRLGFEINKQVSGCVFSIVFTLVFACAVLCVVAVMGGSILSAWPTN